MDMGNQEGRRRPSSGPRIPGYLGRVLNERDRPTGTCFQVAPGVLVTAAHVLNDVGICSTHASVAVDSLEDGGTFRATVAHLDHEHDIAILTSEEHLPAVAEYLAYTDTAPLWTRVSVTGHAVIDDGDHQYRYLVATGEWAGPTERDGIPLGSMTAARTMRGMSGAPVVRDSDRTVIGLVSGRYNAADSWLLGNVWVARTENLVPLLLQLPGVRIDPVPTATQENITVLRVTNGSGHGNELPSGWPQRAGSSPVGAPEREKTQAETLEELQLSTVSIFHTVKGTEASGFFIAPRTILTVKHIMSNSIVGTRYKVSQNGREFAAFVVDVPEELDLAVLEADEPSEFWLPLDRSPAIGDRLLAFKASSTKRGRNSFTAEIEGVVNDEGARLLKFRSGQIAESFVGAPLYNLDRGGVSGVIKSARDSRTSNGGRAVPIASVFEALPSVREIVRDISSPAHRRVRESLSTGEKIEMLAREVLAGDAVAVVGDVLDSSDHLSRKYSEIV
jgi:S1-C subfamily serine protease